MPDEHAIRIPAHTHCRVCGKATPPNKEFCSRECIEKDGKRRKTGKRFNIIFMLVLVGMSSFIILAGRLGS